MTITLSHEDILKALTDYLSVEFGIKFDDLDLSVHHGMGGTVYAECEVTKE